MTNLLDFKKLTGIKLKPTKNNKNLKYQDRITIQRMLDQNYKKAEIARFLNVSRKTITKEIERNSIFGDYQADIAQTFTKYRRTLANQKNSKRINQITNKIRTGLTLRLSPEQIKTILEEDYNILISLKTIYNIITEWTLAGEKIYKYLRIKNKKSAWQSNKNIVSPKKSLKERPKIADLKRREGDWEIDLMEGKKGEAVLLTARSRFSSFILAQKVKDKKAETIKKELKEMFKKIIVHTLSADNGSENTLWQEIEKELNTQIYFCNPGQPWQKGGVENAIGLLRQFFPKGKSLKKITQNEINEALYLINYCRPFKKLNNCTPAEVFLNIPRKKILDKEYNYKFTYAM